jgi:pimeloyl-ACP methyl ester carboxylesterase
VPPVELNYVSEGDGPLVVLLHGFPEFSYSWRNQIPALARAGFRAVAPDLRGYAKSPKPRGIRHYRLVEVAQDVIALIEKLNGGAPCVLVGHDWGGVTAWVIAWLRPDLLRKLVVLNVPHPAPLLREIGRSNDQKRRLLYQLFFNLPLLPELFMRLYGPKLMKKMARFTDDEVAILTRSWRGSLTPMLNYYRAMRKSRGEVRKLLKPIDVPTMMIWGVKERVFIPETLEGTEKWVTNLRIERVQKAGHFVQTDAPERVSELLIEFAR